MGKKAINDKNSPKNDNKDAEDLYSESVVSESKPEETIPITDKSEDKKDTVKVNFMDKKFISDYVKKKTIKSDEPAPEGNTKSSSDSSNNNESTEDLRKRIKKDEEAYENQFTPDDFEELAGFFIDMLDAGISTALRVWSKDTKSRDYELDPDKKKKLAKQGKLILVKHKLKWSVEFVFVLSLVVFYTGPIQKARQRRKTLESIKNTSSNSVKEKFKSDNNEGNKPPKSPRKPPKRNHSEPK